MSIYSVAMHGARFFLGGLQRIKIRSMSIFLTWSVTLQFRLPDFVGVAGDFPRACDAPRGLPVSDRRRNISADTLQPSVGGDQRRKRPTKRTLHRAVIRESPQCCNSRFAAARPCDIRANTSTTAIFRGWRAGGEETGGGGERERTSGF